MDHKSACHPCSHPERSEIEARYLAWHSTRELAGEYGLTEQGIRTHAAMYLLDLRGIGELAPAYSQLVEAGLEAARNGQATPEHALKALEALQSAMGQMPARDPFGDGKPTWEQMVREAEAKRRAQQLTDGHTDSKDA